MFKISTRGQYALLIMTELAEENSGKYVPLKQLAQNHNLSPKYLEQILIQLSKAGLVNALRGNNGGYKLSKKPEEYSAGEILRILEGNLSPYGEMSENIPVDKGNKNFWENFNNVINNYVDSVSLQSMVDANEDDSGYMYYI